MIEWETRATSIVRYAPNSSFNSHTHHGGEEILVLEGVFTDEYGSYSKGTNLRNPIGASHMPRIENTSATIFVKLNQFAPRDSERKVIETNNPLWQQDLVNGLSVLLLHRFGTEQVALVKWAPNTRFQFHRHWGGEEILVLAGTFNDEHNTYPKGTWIRSPHLSQHCPYTREDGALIYVKTDVSKICCKPL